MVTHVPDEYIHTYFMRRVEVLVLQRDQECDLKHPGSVDLIETNYLASQIVDFTYMFTLQLIKSLGKSYIEEKAFERF
jgi:hypothetical protein